MIDTFFKIITWCGSLLILLPLNVMAALFLLRWQRMADAVLLLGGLVGASIITHALKLLCAKPRPMVEDMLVTMPADFSFPSAHTAQIAACALASVLVFRKNISGVELGCLWAGALLLVLFVGYSRIYLQVHYVSDVVAGAFFGGIWVLLLSRIVQELQVGV